MDASVDCSSGGGVPFFQVRDPRNPSTSDGSQSLATGCEAVTRRVEQQSGLSFLWDSLLSFLI